MNNCSHCFRSDCPLITTVFIGIKDWIEALNDCYGEQHRLAEISTFKKETVRSKRGRVLK